MTVLFGHPAGSPFSYHAALAHYEVGRLAAFCVPWMPSSATLRLLRQVKPLRRMAQRLGRREFPQLAYAPKCQGRVGEIGRLLRRAVRRSDEGIAYEANDWLMRTMSRQCRNPLVTAVHAYEDCSLSQFIEAKHLGKACVYDMPIGYYFAWEQTQAQLARVYSEWLPSGGLPARQYARPEQKRSEMDMADLVLVPGTFVERTIQSFYPNKRVAVAPYGVDSTFWHSTGARPLSTKLRFIYAGQVSLRKGTPLLLEAWQKAGLTDAELKLVGPWQLAQSKLALLPQGVTWVPSLGPEELRDEYRRAAVFVFPSFFEGFGLVLLEAMACGLPAIASEATAGLDVITDACGRLVPTGSVDALVEALRWFNQNREQLPMMSKSARAIAEKCSWTHYRQAVTKAVEPFL